MIGTQRYTRPDHSILFRFIIRAMPAYPRKDKHARTGSNLEAKDVAEQLEAESADQRPALERLIRRHDREARKLFTKADLRTAARLASQAHAEWRRASVKVGNQVGRVDALKRSAHRKLARQFDTELPNYGKWRAMRHEQLGERRALIEASLASTTLPRAKLAWGSLPPITAGQEFTAPFSVFDVQARGDVKTLVSDESFAAPEIGHVVNNIVFDHNESTDFTLSPWWAIPGNAQVASMVSCGVSFTMTSGGRLEIAAVLKNLYNRVTFSIHDKFGFSSGDLLFRLQLFVMVIRGSRLIFMPTTLYSNGISSEGGDFSFAVSALDDAEPYTVSGVTDMRFNAGETVQVVAGSEIRISTELDDMHAKLSAVLWWHLQSLRIAVVD